MFASLLILLTGIKQYENQSPFHFLRELLRKKIIFNFDKTSLAGKIKNNKKIIKKKNHQKITTKKVRNKEKNPLVSLNNNSFHLPHNVRNLLLSNACFIVITITIRVGKPNWLTNFSEVSLHASASLLCAHEHILLLYTI